MFKKAALLTVFVVLATAAPPNQPVAGPIDQYGYGAQPAGGANHQAAPSAKSSSHPTQIASSVGAHASSIGSKVYQTVSHGVANLSKTLANALPLPSSSAAAHAPNASVRPLQASGSSILHQATSSLKAAHTSSTAKAQPLPYNPGGPNQPIGEKLVLPNSAANPLPAAGVPPSAPTDIAHNRPVGYRPSHHHRPNITQNLNNTKANEVKDSKNSTKASNSTKIDTLKSAAYSLPSSISSGHSSSKGANKALPTSSHALSKLPLPTSSAKHPVYEEDYYLD